MSENKYINSTIARNTYPNQMFCYILLNWNIYLSIKLYNLVIIDQSQLAGYLNNSFPSIFLAYEMNFPSQFSFPLKVGNIGQTIFFFHTWIIFNKYMFLGSVLSRYYTSWWRFKKHNININTKKYKKYKNKTNLWKINNCIFYIVL